MTGYATDEKSRRALAWPGQKFKPGQPRDDNGRWTSGNWSSDLTKIEYDDPEAGEISDFEKSPRMAAVWGQTYYSDWEKDLSSSESDAIKNYTASDFGRVNGFLRGTVPPQGSYWTSERLDGQVSELDKAIGKSKVPHDIVAYRSFGSFDVDSLEPGTVFQDNGFISTSLTKTGGAEAWGRKGAVEIRIPKGAKGAYVTEKLAARPEERELILARGTQFQIVSKSPNGVVLEVMR